MSTAPALAGATIRTATLACDAEPIARWEPLLSFDERCRAATYRLPRDRHRFTARRGWLRALLAEETGSAPAELRFATGEHGKPYLPDLLALDFSLSHSAGTALAAISTIGPVGCDIEARRSAKADPRVAEHFFSLRERADLARRPAEAWIDGFFAIWTRKEAVVKAIGTGLAMPLQSFSVSLDAPARITEGAAGWKLQPLSAPPGFTAALAIAA